MKETEVKISQAVSAGWVIFEESASACDDNKGFTDVKSSSSFLCSYLKVHSKGLRHPRDPECEVPSHHLKLSLRCTGDLKSNRLLICHLV